MKISNTHTFDKFEGRPFSEIEGKLPVILDPVPQEKYELIHWVAAVLNERPSYVSATSHEELIHLVRLWLRSGPDWSNRSFWQKNGVSTDTLRFRIERALNIEVALIRGRRAHLWIGDAQHARAPGKQPDKALFVFGKLILDPDSDRLKTCESCGTFFVAEKTLLQEKCRPTCGKKESSKEYKARKRKEELENKLTLVRRAIDQYGMLSARQRAKSPDWKAWVKSQHCDITANWISWQVRLGALQPPTAE